MTIIDLLNKIANEEDVPEHIKIGKNEWYFYKSKNTYGDKKSGWIVWDWYVEENKLNDEVKILEEEKKIPEKLDVISWDKCIHDVTHKEKELAIEINKTQELLNNVIDYLKSKGE